MSRLDDLREKIRAFMDEREWDQFHDHKSLASNMIVEAGELLECFMWMSNEEMENLPDKVREKAVDELTDVFKALLLSADKLGVDDVIQATLNKLEKDAKKYPVEKAKGKWSKYTDL